MSTSTPDESPRAKSVKVVDLVMFGTILYCLGVIDGRRAAMKYAARQLLDQRRRAMDAEAIAYHAGRADAALTIAAADRR